MSRKAMPTGEMGRRRREHPSPQSKGGDASMTETIEEERMEEQARLRGDRPMPSEPRLEEAAKVAEEAADWLLDAIAMATQNRMFLRGDPDCDVVACEAILLNAKKAIAVRALPRLLSALKVSRSERAMALEEEWKRAIHAVRERMDNYTSRVIEQQTATILDNLRALSPASDGDSSGAVAPPLPSRAGWQPISTAPKDGTPIYGLTTHDKVVICQCCTEDDDAQEIGIGAGEWFCGATIYRLKAWQPAMLPSPPPPSQEGASEGEGETDDSSSPAVAAPIASKPSTSSATPPAPYPFCRTPDKCAGKGYCPRDIACNE